MIRGPGVVRMLLEFYEGGLGGGYRGDVPRRPGVLVVLRSRTGAQEMVMMAVQGLTRSHRGRGRGVGPSRTAARSEGAPEIRVIQRG